MKNFLLTIVFVLATASAAVAGTPPAITAQEAARIADGYLKDRGILDTTYIAGITIEQASLLKPEPYWLVRWDEALPVEGMRKQEYGLKITFEGKVTRVVD